MRDTTIDQESYFHYRNELQWLSKLSTNEIEEFNSDTKDRFYKSLNLLKEFIPYSDECRKILMEYADRNKAPTSHAARRVLGEDDKNL